MKRIHERKPTRVSEVRLSDAADHPVLRIMELANGVTREPAPYDVAREHDRRRYRGGGSGLKHRMIQARRVGCRVIRRCR
jgi:hypothetical protein